MPLSGPAPPPSHAVGHDPAAGGRIVASNPDVVAARLELPRRQRTAPGWLEWKPVTGLPCLAAGLQRCARWEVARVSGVLQASWGPSHGDLAGHPGGLARALAASSAANLPARCLVARARGILRYPRQAAAFENKFGPKPVTVRDRGLAAVGPPIFAVFIGAQGAKARRGGCAGIFLEGARLGAGAGLENTAVVRGFVRAL